MGSRHRDTAAVTARIPGRLRDDANGAIQARGRTLKDFVVACLRALVADPESILHVLAPHWPEQQRRGRPPGSRDGDG